MQVEHVISGTGHAILIGWLMFGGWWGTPPPPLQVTEVAVLSEQEFLALTQPPTPPEQLSDVVQPAAPEVTPDAPDVSAAPDASVNQPAPLIAQSPAVDAAPAEPETPTPDANVSDQAPELPDPPSEVAVLVPETAPTPVERPADRVAPDPVAQPDPEVTPDTSEETAVTPSETGETVEEPKEATAEPEATDKIVTEADAPPAAAPTKSFRPPARRPEPPTQTAQAPAEAPTQAPSTDTDAAVKAALEAALSSAEVEVATGPPLTSGEKDGLRLAVQKCWNVGTLSSEALRTTVVIKVAMTPEGRPVNNSIQMVSHAGGTDASARQAFEAGRRAVIRCGASGYDLPADKYGQWKDIEITFDPERMR